ncbi:MAG: hypothetical protein HY049_14670 [Acidobacteria bacterium]|nr:hypothetical protein [Acidobacteriota bacterium]
MKHLVFGLGLAVALALAAAPLAAADLSWEERAKAFDYDAAAPLDVKIASPLAREGAKILDISYASPKGGRVAGYLVVPDGKGAFAGVVFVHGEEGSRASFLPEALHLARTGVESILLDAPWRVEDGDLSSPETHRAACVRTVVAIRRAADVLLALPEVDPARLAYVGHGVGATWGGVVAGVEKRFKAYALLAGELNEPLDAVHFVGRSSPSSIFFQWARFDIGVRETDSLAYERAAGEPKVSKWYDSGHELNDPAAAEDRDAWLTAQLGVGVSRSSEPKVAAVPTELSASEITPSMVARGVAYRIAGTDAVRVTRDVACGRGGKAPLLADLYSPAAAGARPPVMILVHADAPDGAAGDPPDWPIISSYGRLLAASGVAALAVRHRSSDEGFRLREAAADVESAMRCARDRAAELGVDGDRVAVWAFGSAVPYAMTAALDAPQKGVRCAVASYGPLDLRPLRKRFPLRVLDDTLANYSPAAYLAAGKGAPPPFLVVRADLDDARILETMSRFVDAARAAGGTVEVLDHPRGRPGFDVLADGTAEEIAAKTIAFIRKKLGLPAD